MNKFNGFTIEEDSDGRMFLFVNENKFSECASFYKEKKMAGLICMGNALSFLKTTNLDFLKLFPFIKQLSIRYTNINNYDGLKHVDKLLSLDITHDKSISINLENCPKLKSLFIDWTSKIENSEKCNKLEYLRLNKYKSKSKNLEQFPFSNSLEKLFLYQGNLESLDGIECFKNLKELTIYNNFKLQNIEAISKLSDNLRLLRIENCKKINNFSSIGNLQKVNELFLVGNNINSISFIKELPNLSNLSFIRSDVKDKDMTPLLGRNWDFVNFDNKKNFSHKLEEVPGHYVFDPSNIVDMSD